MKNSILLTLFLGLSVSFLGCSKDKDEKPEPKNIFGAELRDTSTRTLRVIAMDGKPVAGAQVLIGKALGTPFEKNLLTTDRNGYIVTTDVWSEDSPITIQAAGFLRATYVNSKSFAGTYTLRAAEPDQELELSGDTNGFKVTNMDGQADFGMVISALSIQDLFNLDINKIISPKIDTISALGQKINLPSNVTLPKQKENYILPVNLDKAKYRIYFKTAGPKKMYIGNGQFPFKKVIDQVNAGKQFYELINDFNFLGGSLYDANVVGLTNTLNMTVGAMPFSQSITMKAPTFTEQEYVLSAAVNSITDDLMYPSDLKNLVSNQNQALKVPAAAKPMLVTILQNKAEAQAAGGTSDRMSATIMPLVNGAAPVLLPLLDSPTVTTYKSVKIPSLQSFPNNVTKLATYSLLSKVEMQTVDGQKVKVLKRKWEVYSNDWVGAIELPEWPLEALVQESKLKWEVSLVGTTNAVGAELLLGPQTLNAATHATKSAIEF